MSWGKNTPKNGIEKGRIFSGTGGWAAPAGTLFESNIYKKFGKKW